MKPGERSVSADIYSVERIKVSQNQLTWSRMSYISDMVGEVVYSQINVNWPVNNVPTCIGSIANTLCTAPHAAS
jgi:hypothetical protein